MSGTLSVTDTPQGRVVTAPYALSDAAFVDLAKKSGSTLCLGFAGATGSVVAEQRSTGFSVSAVPEAASHALFAAGRRPAATDVPVPACGRHALGFVGVRR